MTCFCKTEGEWYSRPGYTCNKCEHEAKDDKIAKLEAEIERLRKVAETYSKELIENHDDELSLWTDRDQWKARAEAAEAELQNYRETFATIPHCLECQRWAINTEMEHAPGCERGE